MDVALCKVYILQVAAGHIRHLWELSSCSGSSRGYCIHPYPAGRHAVPSAANKVPLQKLGFQKDLM